MTNQGITDQRNEYKLADGIQPGRKFLLYVEMACNGMFGLTEGIKPPVEDRYFILKEVALAAPNITVGQVRDLTAFIYCPCRLFPVTCLLVRTSHI